MQLTPKLPPGRANRKARHYADQVRRLRAEGYTLEAIREALCDAGVAVSLSTVRREANRPQSLLEMEHLREATLPLEATAPGAQRAVGEGVESRADRDAAGPFPNVMAVLRQIFGSR